MRLALIGLLVMIVTACDTSREQVVEVRLPGPDGSVGAVPSLAVAALPYDRDSILTSMEGRASRPRPHTAILDSLFAEYLVPYQQYLAAAQRSRDLRDSMETLASQLEGLARTDSAYQRVFGNYAQVRQAQRDAEIELAAATDGLERARRRFVPLSDSLRREVRAWKDTTFAGYDTVVNNLVERMLRDPAIDTTDAAGRAAFVLRGKPWWIYARAWDAHDPNSEWYWNVEANGDTLVLDTANGRRVPAY